MKTERRSFDLRSSHGQDYEIYQLSNARVLSFMRGIYMELEEIIFNIGVEQLRHAPTVQTCRTQTHGPLNFDSSLIAPP